MATYQEIKNQQPTLVDCFFAFSNEQFEDGIKRFNLEGKKIYRGFGGLFGTQEGIKRLYDDYDAIAKQVTEQCDPQDVYDYEFTNHECSYTNDDSEAMKIVISHFNKEQYSKVKRRHKFYTTEELEEQMKVQVKSSN